MDVFGLINFCLNFDPNMYFFLISFTVLGGGIKYIDNAFDEKTFSKKLAVFMAPILGVLWAYTMVSHQVAATILLAVLLSVLFKGKIDNLAHQVGLATIIALVFLLGAFNLMLIPLIILTLAGLLDEIGNDNLDNEKIYSKFDSSQFKILKCLFDYRCLMKIGVLLFVLTGHFSPYFFLAFILFDVAYHGIDFYSKNGLPHISG